MFISLAVLVDTKLFILFGYVTDKAALANDAVLILDVSNPERLSFVSQYAGLNNGGASSVGAIAGGVVGGVCVSIYVYILFLIAVVHEKLTVAMNPTGPDPCSCTCLSLQKEKKSSKRSPSRSQQVFVEFC